MSGILGVDPGIRGTGLALFPAGEKYPSKVVTLVPNLKDSWRKRAAYICDAFEEFIYKNRPGDMYIELPVFFASTKRGLQTARQGHLVKLALLTGMLFYIADTNGVEVFTVEPVEWKGKRNKESAHKTIYKVLPDLMDHHSEHALDAIGIALFGKGLVARGLRKRERPA